MIRYDLYRERVEWRNAHGAAIHEAYAQLQEAQEEFFKTAANLDALELERHPNDKWEIAMIQASGEVFGLLRTAAQEAIG